MSKLVAVAGKGGTGKTTVAALAIRWLVEKSKGPVFAVDADPNYTLGDALGVKVEKTIGMLREQFMEERSNIPAGMSKEAVLERQLHAAVHEGREVDLLVMGRQEGPGCYCALNNILRGFLEKISGDYPYVVVDNEAGMEHLSRRNTRRIDLLLVVAEHSVKAARAAVRIKQLAEELELDVKKSLLVLNKAPATPAPEVMAELERTGLEILASLPESPKLAMLDAAGRSLMELDRDDPVFRSLSAGLERALNGG
jgi:CO dehydrogenase maturation factor